MSTRNRPRRPSRLAGITQTPESSFLRRARRRQFDTVPGRTAREWFDVLRPRLLAGVPRENRAHPYLKNSRGKALIVSFASGPSTFRNVIDENGHHV